MKAVAYTKILFVSLFLFVNVTSKTNELECKLIETKNNELTGIWVSENRDLMVKVFEDKQIFYGKLIWFKCTHKMQIPMQDHKDAKNSTPELRQRTWIDMVILSGLKYDGNNKWVGGTIYDPNSGKTFSASVSLQEDKITVRGYWGIELIGKSMYFNRYKKND